MHGSLLVLEKDKTLCSTINVSPYTFNNFMIKLTIIVSIKIVQKN